MRREDAPPPGWYPDPEGGARLRYWEGLDWGDRFRAPPRVVPAEEVAGATDWSGGSDAAGGYQVAGGGLSGIPRADSQAIISEVRQAAREEAERAAQLLGEQARDTVRSVTPLISQYTDRATMWLRRIAIIVTVLVIAYFVFQAWAQASLFDWLGERFDNLTDSAGGGPAGVIAAVVRR